MEYVKRTAYLDKIKEFRDKHLIKVLTGIRRSGKSVILEQFRDYLKAEGVTDEQIIYVNYEELENEELLDYKKLHEYVLGRACKEGKTYVFLDEIQMVENFEKAVDSLYTKKNFDIYLTGSNSFMLSGQLATLLSGRYIAIHILPLSFAESCSLYREKGEWYAHFLQRYLKFGGFPALLELPNDKAITDYLEGSIYSTVVTKDILAREKGLDAKILGEITKFVFHSVGSEISAVKIADTLTSARKPTTYNTVAKYLELLKAAFLIYEVGRYDIKGKQHLKQNAKYYTVDTGLRNALLLNKEPDTGHLLENVIFLELLRREYKIAVGKNNDKEVDFVCEKLGEKMYIQVCKSIDNKDTLQREVDALNGIKDHYPKYIITMDAVIGNDINGIRIINAVDFLQLC